MNLIALLTVSLFGAINFMSIGLIQAQDIFTAPNIVRVIPNAIHTHDLPIPNDLTVEFFVVGNLTNTCQKLGPSIRSFTEDDKIIIELNIAEYEGEYCIDMEIPFNKDFRLLIKKDRDYRIFFRDNDENLHLRGHLPLRYRANY